MPAPGGLQTGWPHHSDHWRTVGLSPDDLVSQGGTEAAAGPQPAEEPCANQSRGTRQSPSLKRRERGWEEVPGTAPRLTCPEHGGKPGHSHLGTQSPASRNATAAQARLTPPLTPGGPGSSYLFQLTVDVLNDQVDSHCVSTPWSEPEAKARACSEPRCQQCPFLP